MYLLYWSSVFFLVYMYVLYPLLLFVWPKRRTAFQELSDSELPEITIILCAYNEEHNVVRKLVNCLSSNYPAELIKFIIVSDGATDGTVANARSFHADILLIENQTRNGKAFCLNQAIQQCHTDIAVLMDMRQDISGNALRSLVSKLQDDEVVVASGNLCFLDEDKSGEVSLGAYWKYEKMIRAAESNIHSVVGVTGALYAIKTSSLSTIPNQTVLDDVLIPMNAIRNGKRAIFDKNAKVFDVPPAEKSNEKRRKIRTIAGNFQILELAPWLLVPSRNPVFLQYFSHKVLRLLGPLFIFLFAVSSLALVDESWIFVFSLATFLCSFVVWLSGEYFKLFYIRLLPYKLLDAFYSLNVFAVYGFLSYMRRDSLHIWKK